MKKTLTLTLLLLCSVAFSQKIDLHLPKYTSTKTYKPRYGIQVSPTMGLGMILGGAVFTTAGLLTGDVTEEVGGQIVSKPFYKQGAKALAITSGAFLIGCGIIVVINTK